MTIEISTPLTEEKVKELKAGDKVLLSGVLYTSRDAAHKRMVGELNKGGKLPFDVENNVIYYVGPAPAKEGEVIGSAGPTTSYRMDPYAPYLLDKGLKGMIGKGDRSREVIESMIKNKAVYFAAVGGAAALLADKIKKVDIIAYDDLGTEAVRKMEVEKLPLVVVIDCKGNNLYETEKNRYKKI
ncbi:hydro-lyase, Fe-S type, tartrate/fumarate subfamily, beta region [Vallitalea longa]|uniref:Hydro-lyase, Fe-S type, tartrate/fumarate subfamily, beta region n=1 Tax=Vallitalea longa TaxID=2936439 RepID=A0A9W5YBA7_9FIRM|nr:Fe-S-containing hydro-lyase [Vallitalea longa]GKX30327.1 hydro-lyase, Fe-S type, tartrate/fumarate subfamily, beta region [Vallitalea longa]